jgi:hypothetical protein
MIKLFDVSLANNGWVVSYPPEDEEHTQQDSLYLDTKKDIETMLFDLVDGLAIDHNLYIVKIIIKKVKKPSRKETYWLDMSPIPMAPVKEGI